jgi:hypothetical protein
VKNGTCPDCSSLNQQCECRRLRLYYWGILRLLAEDLESAWESAPEHVRLVGDGASEVVAELMTAAEEVWMRASTTESVLGRMDDWETRIQECGLDARRLMISAVQSLNAMHKVDMDLSMWVPELKPGWWSHIWKGWKYLTRG